MRGRRKMTTHIKTRAERDVEFETKRRPVGRVCKKLPCTVLAGRERQPILAPIHQNFLVFVY